jgi:hypothetical protein
VNTYTTDNQSQPAVAMDASGGFVVAWRSYDGSSADIFARRYSSGGVALSPEFLVNTYTTQSQFEPVVADDGAGNVVIAWTSAVPHFSSSDVFAQRYDAGSNPLGGEFRVNTITTYSQTAPTVAADASGNFIVAWSTFANGADDDTAAQRFAAARTIAGKKLLVKDTGSSETMRKVVVVATESSTDVGPTVLGDPVSNGGTLRVVTRGTLDSDQTYVLDAAGWTAAGSVGFRYSGPTGGDGDPVKKLLIKRTPGGKALLKAVLSGSVGTQMLDVVPPDTGDEAGIVLSINGGAVYCAGFGGAAGGAETADDAQRWKVLNAVAQPGCPTP